MRKLRDVWLPKAKQLAVGRTARITLAGDLRPNLVVGNDAEKYWCFHHSKQRGDVVAKEHVKLGVQAPVESTKLELPKDLTDFNMLPLQLRLQLAAFLSRKGMALLMLPQLQFSVSRQRLYIITGNSWYARDVTENSPQKWLECSRDGYEFARWHPDAQLNIVTEDLFSMYKVAWAMPDCNVVCSLGTALPPRLVTHLITSAKPTFMMYDGDAAGIKGADRESKRLRTLGVPAWNACAPVGFDPKDLTHAQINELVLDQLRRLYGYADLACTERQA